MLISVSPLPKKSKKECSLTVSLLRLKDLCTRELTQDLSMSCGIDIHSV